MDYNFILKFENLEIEQKFMLETLGLKNIIYLHQVHQNSRLLSLSEKRKYYQMLSKDDKRQLIDVYKLDFYLFDYNPEPYLWTVCKHEVINKHNWIVMKIEWWKK